MQKNDKKMVVIGVIVMILASAGVYTWMAPSTEVKKADFDSIIGITGVMSKIPDAITVSDSCPFYPLIVTPIAVHYDNNGNQEVVPLYIENSIDPSDAVLRAKSSIGRTVELNINDNESLEKLSIDLAKKYWKESKAVLLIKNNEEGYNLGVIATPIASYLSIPIIVADNLTSDISVALSELGVEYSIVCGDIDGYGTLIEFENIDDIINAKIELIKEKFGDLNYITLTNPIDAFPPKVLDKVSFTLGPKTISSQATTQIVNMAKTMLLEDPLLGTFTIPKDYKYALVKFEGINLNYENVDELGDDVGFIIGANLPDIPKGLQSSEFFSGNTGSGGNPIRDSNGNIIKDRVYTETVLYDRGGVEYTVNVKGRWLAQKEGDVTANIVIEKLEDPVYPLMKQLSSISPYLTAYHKGIIFGKPEFAFTADDDKETSRGEKCPGYYVPMKNPRLVELSNKHIYDEIYLEMNKLLGKIADIDYDDTKSLTNYYKNNPIYIALVGGATVLPQYIYDNYNEPIDVENAQYRVGVGTPSDFIYGNIDPIQYDWSNIANDIYSEYPYQENIVGRITGWDAQDASAIITRTIFYNDVIRDIGEWKDNYAILIGSGQDFQKPPLRYLIFGKALGMTYNNEPMKLPTGYGQIAGERTIDQVIKPLGFNVLDAWAEEGMKEGFSDDALSTIKKTTLLNRLLFNKREVSRVVGEDVVKGGEYLENSNFIWVNAHGSRGLFLTSGIDTASVGIGGPILHRMIELGIRPFMGGAMGPGTSLESHGHYNTREVENMDFGPSFMWLESCICGKIDGVYPKTSIAQTLLHSGVNSLIAASTTSNIGGGYLEPKNKIYDTPFSILTAYIKTRLDARKGEYPEPHFGYKIYTDLCEDLRENDVSIGLAFRNAKNNYLPSDADWEVWWAPPLITTGDRIEDIGLLDSYNTIASGLFGEGKDTMMGNKYTSFYEYLLFGDPAFNPYEPCNNG